MSTKPDLNLAFKALADPTRRELIERLSATNQDGISVSELASPFLTAMSLPAVSKHLRVLEQAGLLTQKKEGKTRLCKLEGEALKEVRDWVQFHLRFWENQLDALADFVEQDKQPSLGKRKKK